MSETEESGQILRTVVTKVSVAVNVEQRTGNIKSSASELGTVEWDKAFGHCV